MRGNVEICSPYSLYIILISTFSVLAISFIIKCDTFDKLSKNESAKWYVYPHCSLNDPLLCPGLIENLWKVYE